MEELIRYQGNLLKQVNDQFKRSLYDHLPWDQRMLAIKGLRGVGKTTILLQRLKYDLLPNGIHGLYVTLDHPWFYTHSLYDLASEFHTLGGKYLFLDEIHKYPQWSRELKVIYDGFPDMHVVFTASSALEVYRGESDLSRRVLTYELPGLSFREFLKLDKKIDLPPVSLETILGNHECVAQEISENLKPIPLFREYLARGYFPFTVENTIDTFTPRLLGIINNVLEFDLSFIEGYSTSGLVKVRQLLGIIAESVPFQPNVSALARKMNIGRDTLNNYFQHLAKGQIIALLQKESSGVAALQKPAKIYLDNTNFSFALNQSPDVGNLRETFLLSQLRNTGTTVELPVKGDFYLPNGQLLFEVGGKNKTFSQIKDQANSYVVADDIEVGYKNKIPLWLFGLMY